MDTTKLNWKSLYASDLFQWRTKTVNGRDLQYRHLGMVENFFDLDGIDYEGRADLNINIAIEVKTRLTVSELRRRTLLVWSYMCLRHPLLACKSLYGEEFLPGYQGQRWIDKCFVYDKPLNGHECINSARNHIVFVQDSYDKVDVKDFYKHVMNTRRAVDEKKSLAKLFIMPFEETKSGTFLVSPILIAGHEIADGLTVFRWSDDFVHLLNMKEQVLLDGIERFCSDQHNQKIRMPVAQEALYPVYTKNAAKDRWNWAITYILRHVHRPPPAAFQNPLRRETPLKGAVKMEGKYSKVLDYSKTPPLNAFTLMIDLPRRATDNLVKLCRQAGISVGSGAFTLVGMMMMRFEEERNPGIPYWERLSFVGSFPVNPRPFLSGVPTTGKEDSLMLAFSDGVTLPFVPSEFDFAKTFRVLGRVAHRQLRQYQKRKRTPAETAHLGSRSPRELVPATYLSTMQRLESKVKPEQRVGLISQDAYPARNSPTLATCGISSVGDITSLITSDRHDLEDEKKDVAAVFQGVRSTVRSREGEFLVGAIGTRQGMSFGVSYDGSTIDPEKAEAWKMALQSILDVDVDFNKSTDAIPSVVEKKMEPKL